MTRQTKIYKRDRIIIQIDNETGKKYINNETE